jgi:hypothetical protein
LTLSPPLGSGGWIRFPKMVQHEGGEYVRLTILWKLENHFMTLKTNPRHANDSQFYHCCKVTVAVLHSSTFILCIPKIEIFSCKCKKRMWCLGVTSSWPEHHRCCFTLPYICNGNQTCSAVPGLYAGGNVYEKRIEVRQPTTKLPGVAGPGQAVPIQWYRE